MIFNLTYNTNFIDEGIFDGPIPTYRNDYVTSINWFPQNCGAREYSFANCTTIGPKAFMNNSYITSIYAPNCTVIGSSAFSGCSNLKNINFPKCIFVSASAFVSTSIQSLTLGTINDTYLYNRVYPLKNTLQYVSLSQCLYLNTASIFDGFIKLTEVDIPQCSIIPIRTFRSCNMLSTLDLPKCKKISAYAFDSCSNMTITLGEELTSEDTITFATNAFTGINYLSLYLLAPTAAVLTSAASTILPYRDSSYYTDVYVPASLFSIYQTETNWNSLPSGILHSISEE